MAKVSCITLIDTLIILEILANVNTFAEGGTNLYQKYVKLRDRVGVSDYAVAKQTGVSTATLTNWKYGRYTPKFDKLLALAKYFGVSVEYFVEDEKEDA